MNRPGYIFVKGSVKPDKLSAPFYLCMLKDKTIYSPPILIIAKFVKLGRIL